MSTISYNNKQIYSTDTSNTVTLVCSRKTALSDIVIVFTSDGSVTYHSSKTPVSKGQTATLKCANKFFKSNIVCEFISNGEMPEILKLATPVIRLVTSGEEPEILKLETPVIRLETEGGGNSGSGETSTPAILGMAILGRTILGVVTQMPKLATPQISLKYSDGTEEKLETPIIRLVTEGEEPEIIKLATPVIELVVINDGDEPELLKLDTPVIRLEIVEDSGDEPDTPTEPIKLNTPVIYLETVSDGGEEPSEPDIPEVPEIIKLEAPVIELTEESVTVPDEAYAFLPLRTLNFVEADSYEAEASTMQIYFHVPSLLQTNTTYRVLWDGQEYICQSYNKFYYIYDGKWYERSNYGVYLGDFYEVVKSERYGNPIPFYIHTLSDEDGTRMTIITENDGKSHEIGIYTDDGTINKCASPIIWIIEE